MIAVPRSRAAPSIARDALEKRAKTTAEMTRRDRDAWVIFD
jgi:hypothetical protein